jgi:hypothetical protein
MKVKKNLDGVAKGVRCKVQNNYNFRVWGREFWKGKGSGCNIQQVLSPLFFLCTAGVRA